MKHKSKFDASWDKGHDRAKDHKLDIDLDLKLSDFIRSKNIPVELAMNESRIRQEIFDIVTQTIVPNIVLNAGHKGNMPAGKLETKWENEHESDWEAVETEIAGDMLEFQTKMRILMNLTSDRSVDAMQALMGGKAGLASLVTDHVIDALKSKYMGTKKIRTHTKTRTVNGVVHREIKSESDFNRN